MYTEEFREFTDYCFSFLSSHGSNLTFEKSALYCTAQWAFHFIGSTNITRSDLSDILETDSMQKIKMILFGERNYMIQLEIVYSLCLLIRKAKFIDERAKRFYRLYLPCVVTDTSFFSEKSDVLSSTGNGPVSCTMIHLAMVFAECKLGTKEIYSMLAPDVFIRWKSTIEEFGVDYDDFERYWNAVHYLKTTCTMRKRQKVEKAIKVYKKYNAPVSVLLFQYAQAKHFTTRELHPSANPWGYVQKKRKTAIQESGMSVEERLYNDAVYQISREAPTEVIHSIFYKDRDDSPMESALVRSEIKRLRSEANNILILNSSPAFLREYHNLEVETNNKPDKSQVTFAVHDDILAFLYHDEFPGYQFIRIDSLSNHKGIYDLVVILARDYETVPLWGGLYCCDKNANVLMLVPQTAMSGSDTLLLSTMKEYQIHIDWILDVPAGLTKSVPRKKMLIHARKGDVYGGRNIFLLQAVSDKGANYLTLVKKQYTVSPEILDKGLTLVQIRSIAKAAENGNSVKQSRDSQIYHFSQEIKICYNIIKDNGKIERARAYYRNIYRPETEINRSKGKRPNNIKTERGLRGKSEQEILGKLEQVALYEEYCGLIVADIKDYYKADLSCLTVKTMWFCCRSELISRISYNESIALEMFCGPNQSLSNLICGDCTPDDLVAAMETLYGQDGAGKKEWLQLNLIFQVAVMEGILKKNPLASFVHVVKEENRNRIYMLNAALRKSHFTADEERRMVAFIREPIPLKGREGVCPPRYVLESKWLAGAFSLFAGLPVREICPLRWGDLNRIDDLEEMQLCITKHLNAKEEVISNVNYGNKVHFRKIALDLTLSRMLMERKSYLVNQCGYREEDLVDIPIMLECEPSGRGRRKLQMITKTTVRKVNQQLMEEAKIPNDLISLLDGDDRFDVDLNAQRNDLFAANFRHKAYNICGFTVGELCHYVGNKAPDTFSRHYCDYGNDFLQYNIVRKLYRWTYVYELVNKKVMPSRYMLMEHVGQEYNTGRYADGLAHAEVTLYFKDDTCGSLRLEIGCNHGFDGMVVAIGKGGGKE